MTEKQFANFEEQYFDLLLNFCLKIDKILFISCDRVCEQTALKFQRFAKKNGVQEVHIFWQDAKKEAEILRQINCEEIKNHPAFDMSEWNEYADRGAAFMIFKTEIPKVFNGIDERKLVEAAKVKRLSQSQYKTKQLSYKVSWTIAILPNEVWAQEIYPQVENAYDKFYTAIFETCMIDGKGNIVEKWQKQLSGNSALADKLNKLQITQLHYTAPNGTDLTVKLRPTAVWLGADKGGMVVNMPTYEVFTFPDAGGIDGIVKSTRLLKYNGAKIDDFELRFKNGKVVDVKAKCGEEALKFLTACDSGSNSLGEVAIVDCQSPVALQNKAFGITLLDENAACHFAFGNAYPSTFKNYASTPADKLLDEGFNVSSVHVDFMVGYDKLTITAKTVEGEITVMKDGRIIL